MAPAWVADTMRDLCLSEKFNSQIKKSMKLESDTFEKFYQYMNIFIKDEKENEYS